MMFWAERRVEEELEGEVSETEGRIERHQKGDLKGKMAKMGKMVMALDFVMEWEKVMVLEPDSRLRVTRCYDCEHAEALSNNEKCDDQWGK